MTRQEFSYWILHSGMTEFAQRDCTKSVDGDRCPHCRAVGLLAMVGPPRDLSPEMLEGLDYQAERVSSAVPPRLYRSPLYIGV